MKFDVVRVVPLFAMLFTTFQVQAAPCSSYYIAEITVVSPADTEAGHVQTFVGFGASKEVAEQNALGSCSHIKLDLQTCLESDRILGPNSPSDAAGNFLHLKYMKAGQAHYRVRVAHYRRLNSTSSIQNCSRDDRGSQDFRRLRKSRQTGEPMGHTWYVTFQLQKRGTLPKARYPRLTTTFETEP